MTSLPVTQARAKLYQLLDEAAESHEPIQITGKRGNAVLVSEEDWRSMQATLYLLSIPHAGINPKRDGRAAREGLQESWLVNWSIVYTKQAQKDSQKLASSNLKAQAQHLLEIVAANPFQNPPPYRKAHR